MVERVREEHAPCSVPAGVVGGDGDDAERLRAPASETE